jgi:hypothetical protein
MISLLKYNMGGAICHGAMAVPEAKSDSQQIGAGLQYIDVVSKHQCGRNVSFGVGDLQYRRQHQRLGFVYEGNSPRTEVRGRCLKPREARHMCCPAVVTE